MHDPLSAVFAALSWPAAPPTLPTPWQPPPPPAAGAYLIDNGRTLILWLGQALPPAFYQQVFGLQGPPQDATGAHRAGRAGRGWLTSPGHAAGHARWAPGLLSRLLARLLLPVLLPSLLPSPSPASHAHPSAAALNPEPVRQGSELSMRINAVLRQLRGSKELWQVGWGLGCAEEGR